MNPSLIGGLVIFGIIALYFITYILNKNTEAPETDIVVDKCGTCGSSGACALVGTKEAEECEI